MPRLQSPLPSLQKPAFDKRSSPALSAGLGALSPKLGGWEGESLRTETVTADAGIPRAGSLAQARGHASSLLLARHPVPISPQRDLGPLGNVAPSLY